MSSVHFHLLANHFPVIGTFFCTILLAAGVFRRNRSFVAAAKYLLILLALVAIPVYYSGEFAEDAVSGIPGITDEMVEIHEGAAKISIIALSVTAILSVISLVINYRKKAFRTSITYIVLICTVITLSTFARTGLLGGKIRHTEIRNDASAVQLQQEIESESDD